MKTDGKKVLFVHDGPLYKDEQSGLLYGVHYDNKLIERYMFFGQQVTFLMRQEAVSSEKARGYSPLNLPGFVFVPIPNFKSIRTYLTHKRSAIRIIKETVLTHDIIIIRLPSAAGILAYKYAKLFKKAVFIEMVACVYDALWNYDWRGKLMAHYKLYQYKRLIRNAHHTLYVTRKFLQSRYPTKGKSVACSDVVLSSVGEETLDMRLDRIKRTQRPYILCTVAALDVPYKGQKDVIRAIKELKDQGVPFKYKLVGQGNPASLKAQAIKYGVEELIEIVGPLPHDQIFTFLDSIDIYIQPSKQEGLPRAMIEALSRGCPSLGARTAGIPELIADVCIFKAGNVRQIVSKLKEVDNSWLSKHAHINFNTANDFRKETLEKRRIDFYNQFLADWNL